MSPISQARGLTAEVRVLRKALRRGPPPRVVASQPRTRAEPRRGGRMVGRKQVIHQAVPDGGGKGSSGSLPESRMLALARSSDTSPNHTASPCLPGKLLEARGRRRMDARPCGCPQDSAHQGDRGGAKGSLDQETSYLGACDLNGEGTRRNRSGSALYSAPGKGGLELVGDLAPYPCSAGG